MKKANTIIKETIKDRSIAATADKGRSVASPVHANNGSQKDHIDVINQLFAELELAYHNQYHKAYAAEGSIALAKKYWLECLGHFSPQIILQATRTVVTTQEYLPSVATIIQACEEAMTHFGLPSAHDAYVEACCAPNPKAEFPWSHPAVYLAGKETGWFELANKAEARVFPLFQCHYRNLCQRSLHGEALEITVPEALPEQSSKKLSLEENKERMKALRKQLKT